MKTIVNHKLFKEALERLRLNASDYVANAILLYNEQEEKIYDQILNMTVENKEEVVKEAHKHKEALIKLKCLINNSMGNDYVSATDKEGFNKTVSKYVLRNVKNLCPNEELFPYYKRIHLCLNNLKSTFSDELKTAIILRSLKIIEDFYKAGDEEALNRFMLLFEFSSSFSLPIVYVIYYALFDGELIKANNHSKYSPNKKEKDKRVTEALLENNKILPDDIIKEIFISKQFKDFTPRLTCLIINSLFRVNDTILYFKDVKDIKECVQRIFYNDVNDLDSKAELLDLSSLINQVNGDGQGLSNAYTDELVNILTGNKKLARKEKTGYGAI